MLDHVLTDEEIALAREGREHMMSRRFPDKDMVKKWSDAGANIAPAVLCAMRNIWLGDKSPVLCAQAHEAINARISAWFAKAHETNGALAVAAADVRDLQQRILEAMDVAPTAITRSGPVLMVRNKAMGSGKQVGTGPVVSTKHTRRKTNMKVGKVTYTRSQPEVIIHMSVGDAYSLKAALDKVPPVHMLSMPQLSEQLARVLEACRSTDDK